MAAAGGSDKFADLIYGVQAVREALRAGRRPFQKILLGRRDPQTADIVRLAKNAGVPVHVEPKQALDRVLPTGKHQGVIAIVAATKYAHADEILARAAHASDSALLVVLDGVQDPHNLGAVLRTAEAAGVHGVFIPERRAVGLTPAVAKASAGALEHVPVAAVVNIGRLLEDLKQAGLWVYGFDETATTSYLDLDLTGPVGLVFGGEGEGVRRSVLDACDQRARIPMRGRLHSLNVSAAAAVVLFEAVRQRGGQISGSGSSHPESRP